MIEFLRRMFSRAPAPVLKPAAGNSLEAELPGFDEAHYRSQFPDGGAGLPDPLVHFLRDGWRQGLDPSPGFSTLGYLGANPDVATARTNPLIHYLDHGLAEGRSPNPALDHEPMLVRFVPGTRDRVRAALTAGEDPAAFVRAAVERELDARRSR